MLKCRWCGKEITEEQSKEFEGTCGPTHMESIWRIQEVDRMFAVMKEDREKVKVI